jgi:hypothetical protein
VGGLRLARVYAAGQDDGLLLTVVLDERKQPPAEALELRAGAQERLFVQLVPLEDLRVDDLLQELLVVAADLPALQHELEGRLVQRAELLPAGTGYLRVQARLLGVLEERLDIFSDGHHWDRQPAERERE